MALTHNEKELLAVVKYFNQEVANKHVARMVAKLDKEFGRQVACELTGFSNDSIMEFVISVPARKVGPSKATKKVQASIREASTELDGEKGNEEIEIDGLAFIDEGVIKPKAKPSMSDAITLDADSPLHERIAYEMSKQIGDKFQKGDAFYTTKSAMEAFEFHGAGKLTIQGALKLLKNKGLIEYRNGNYREGYVVS